MVKKTVLYIHHGKGIGGAPLSLLYLIKSLDRRLYYPVVLFLHDSEIIDRYRAEGIDVVGPARVYDFAHTAVWWFSWKHPYLLARALKDTIKTAFFTAPVWFNKIKPDIVHLNTSSLIGWAYAAHKKNIPVVWHVREPLAGGYFGMRRAFIIRSIRQLAHTIIPICRYDARPWSKQKNVSIIYNCVDDTFFNSAPVFLQEASARTRLLFLGGTSHAKGFDGVLEVMTRLVKKMPDVQCLIAGYRDNNSFLRRCVSARARARHALIKQLGQSLVFLGPVNNVSELMASTDVLLSPFVVSHFARPIIEAGSIGLPVIASKISPFEEIVLHEKTGYLIAPDDYDAWVEALVILLKDSGLRKTMGEAARAFCKDRFSQATYKWHIEKVYREIERG